jgi:uncharacterized protein
MEDPKATLNAALKQAMIEKDSLRRDVIRMMLSEVKQVEVDQRREVTADDVMTVLQREVKKRRESVDEATKVGRNEIADAVKAEIAILETFLPKQLSREEITVFVKEAISQTGVTSAKEMGKVMGALMLKVKGKADGKLVNDVVRELLGS